VAENFPELPELFPLIYRLSGHTPQRYEKQIKITGGYSCYYLLTFPNKNRKGPVLPALYPELNDFSQ